MTEGRRFAVPFDPDHFAHRAAEGDVVGPTEAFRRVYERNHWAAASRSGGGADLTQTAAIRRELPGLLRRWHVTTMLDLPCGDGRWMAKVPLPPGLQYLGADVIPELVADCREMFGTPGRRYLVRNILDADLPRADLLFCRDCLVHFSYRHVARAVRAMKKARIGFVLTTTFPAETANVDIVTGDWRPLNLERPPFGFPEPLERLMEECTEQDGLFADKSLGLWRVRDLPDLPDPAD